MRIDTSNRTTGVNRREAAGRGGAGRDFTPIGADTAQRASASAPVAGMTGIDALLALQAVGSPLERKKRVLRRGHTLLDMLETIKGDLLIGRVGADRLDALVSTLAGLRESSEPGLEATLDEIELRVRVELAKLGRFPTT